MKYKKSDESEWNYEVKQLWKGVSNRTAIYTRKNKRRLINILLLLEETLVINKYKTWLIYMLLSWFIFVNVRCTWFLGKYSDLARELFCKNTQNPIQF